MGVAAGCDCYIIRMMMAKSRAFTANRTDDLGSTTTVVGSSVVGDGFCQILMGRRGMAMKWKSVGGGR